MSDWKDTIRAIAPTVAAAIGGPLAGMAVAALGDVLGTTPEAVKRAISDVQLTAEQLAAIQQAELKLKSQEAELGFRFEELATTAVTQRWQADMASDSTLSKNIRPMVLIYLLTLYALFAVLSAFDINVEQSYVVLLGNWGMLVMSAYFAGRTVEKTMAMRK